MDYGLLHPGMTHSGNKNTPYRLPTLLDDLATAWKSQNTLQKMGLLPVVGDVAGFAGDVQSMVENPEERTWLNGLLSAAGLLPFVPAGIGTIKKADVTVMRPERVAFPGIYEDPREIAKAAAKNTSPEDPSMFGLFGVTRDDLYEMNKGRKGNQEPNVKTAKNPKGSTAARNVINPRNTQRIVDVLAEAGEYPELYKGMDAWYEMRPLYERIRQISDNPVEAYNRFNNLTGMASPGSDVLTEINRGTAANYLLNAGRWDDFIKYGGVAGPSRGADFPEDMRGVMGHPYHKTAQATPMDKYVKTGEADMKSPKVPLYIQSAGVPEVGFQTKWPVGDAHFSRGVGLADTRTNKNYGASISMPELVTVGPWWEKKVAAPLGLDSVQAQARGWGTFAPFTGVDTPVGAPKLELISMKIMDTAKALGISPEEARDMILLGEAYAPNLGLLGIK